MPSGADSRAEHADLLTDLTPAQVEAVTHFEGPLLILAAAGSGKTRVITRRVAWLLRQGVRPHNILAITFTNKAAGEMRQRIETLVPGSRVWISTFHAMGARLLRQYADRLGLDRNFTIYDQSDRIKLVKQALEEADLDATRFTPEGVQAAISKAKNQLLGPERYAEKAHDFFTQAAAHVYPIYEKRLRNANALDFDDLLYWPALAMKHDAELRTELDARFRFVLIDEYQDTNYAQYMIARGLSSDYRNLCVVGDPDQSIYKFRGSDIRIILDFERDYPDARVITLEKNYRSTKHILRAAGHLIEHNRKRKPKSLVTDNPEGKPVGVLTFETGRDEAEGIVRRIRDDVKAGRYRWGDVAIFLRINALSRGLESEFMTKQIPYQIVKGVAFYERKENRDVLAYLRLLLNPRDDLSFLRIVNEPARGIGKVSLEHLRQYAETSGIGMLAAAAEVARIVAIKGKAATSLRAFAEMMSGLRQFLEATPDEIMRQVLDRSGYRRMLQDSHEEEAVERLANVEELVTAAKQFADEDSSRTIADYLETVTLTSDVDGLREDRDCVSVMTLHAAKGLEFPIVFMPALEQGILPHERSLGRDDEEEEERRLAFVGMTRAKQELYLSHAHTREFRGQTNYAVPSMFLSELPADAVEEVDQSANARRSIDTWRSGGDAARQGWIDAGVAPPPRRDPPPATPKPAETSTDYVVGMVIKHPTYGRGRITEVSGYGPMRRLKIRFSTAGERTFVADKVKLEIVSRS